MWILSRSAPNARRTLQLLFFSLNAISGLALAGCDGFVSGKPGAGPSSQSVAITNVQASAATTSGFQASWVTNVAANSQVEYGITASYGSSTPVSPVMTIAHAITVAGLAPGTSYHFRVHSADAANNAAVSADQTFATIKDNSSTPQVSVAITFPIDGATLSGMTNLTAAVTSNAFAIKAVQFKVNGANSGSPFFASPYNYVLNTTALPNGKQILTAVVADAGGNTATSAAVTVNVNNPTAPPSVPTGLQATATAPSEIDLSWNASTGNAGLAGYTVYRGGVKLATTPSTSYKDTGLAASTSYSYSLAAYDAAGNSSAQSPSVVATTTASPSSGPTSSKGLPSSLGWYQIPNTAMQSVCPPNNFGGSTYGFSDVCHNIIDAWGGGAADTSRNRLLVWGGGHSDYSGNELYSLDLNSLTVNRLTNPALPLSTSCSEALAGPTPNARHSYDGLTYLSNSDQLLAVSGALAPTGCASSGTWTFNMKNLEWTQQSPSGEVPNYGGGVVATAYDPNTGVVFISSESYGAFATYNYATNTYTVLNRNDTTDYHSTAVIDPTRKLFFLFGLGNAYKIDISGADSHYTLTTITAAGCGFINAVYPGVAFDSSQKLIVGWAGGNTVYLYNPDTDSCTSATYPNGPGAQAGNGTYKRFSYFPALNVFALVNGFSENAYVLRLTSPSGTGGGTVGSSGPVISGVNINTIMMTSAIISWNTNVPATTQVEYGPSTAYGNLTTLNSSLVTTHLQVVGGLSAGSLYHYRVHSKDSAGNDAVSGDFAFSTTNTPDTSPPSVSITGPANNATVSGSVAVTASAVDNVGVTSVQFLLDNAKLGTALIAPPFQIPWDTTGATNGVHTLSATASDAAGNVATAIPLTVTVTNSGVADADSDFHARCQAPGVLKCVGWDDPSDFVPAQGGGGYADGLYPASDGIYRGTMDSSIKMSGAGSLKFTIPPGSSVPMSSTPAGYWRANFGSLNSLQAFGPHTTLYLQFRLRLSPELLNFDWTTVSNEGWKVFIAYGPIPGPSCTGAQFVQENTYQRNVATAYTSCGTPGLQSNNGVPPMLIEQGDYNCAYGTNYATDPNCFQYPANVWLTEYWVVQIGDYGQPNTHFTAYIARDGEPLKRFIDLPGFTFNRGASPGDAIESILLDPYFSGAIASTSTPGASMWFDELIVSTQPIAAPKF
jgi:chitodextrinase